METEQGMGDSWWSRRLMLAGLSLAIVEGNSFQMPRRRGAWNKWAISVSSFLVLGKRHRGGLTLS